MITQFMRNTKYANTEFEMQLIPGFTLRRSGMSVSRFEYSARDCDCSACAYQARKKKCTSPAQCICLRERLLAGCVPLTELLGVLTKEMPVRPFVARVSRLSWQPLSIFENGNHQIQFEAAHKENLTGSAGQTAAVFLLTPIPFFTPEGKLKMIRDFQSKGHLVAMTGDGTNDAPALAQADVAVAMNTGTQAAKEAGNMVDLDSSPTKLIDIVRIGKQLLMTRGSLTTFSIANDVAKYFGLRKEVVHTGFGGDGSHCQGIIAGNHDGFDAHLA